MSGSSHKRGDLPILGAIAICLMVGASSLTQNLLKISRHKSKAAAMAEVDAFPQNEIVLWHGYVKKQVNPSLADGTQKTTIENDSSLNLSGVKPQTFTPGKAAGTPFNINATLALDSGRAFIGTKKTGTRSYAIGKGAFCGRFISDDKTIDTGLCLTGGTPPPTCKIAPDCGGIEICPGEAVTLPPIAIITLAEFKGMKSNKKYILQSDIDFGNTPASLGSSATPMTGIILDGNGHTVKNVREVTATAGNDSAGIFRFLQTGVIKNLNLEDVYLDSPGFSGGLIARGSNSVCFENINLQRITIKNGVHVGGLAGAITEVKGTGIPPITTNSKIGLKNITANVMSLTGLLTDDFFHTVGGLVGFMSLPTSIVVDTVTIKKTDIKGFSTGGVIGTAQTRDFLVTSTHFIDGTIDSVSNKSSPRIVNYRYAGGLIGAASSIGAPILGTKFSLIDSSIATSSILFGGRGAGGLVGSVSFSTVEYRKNKVENVTLTFRAGKGNYPPSEPANGGGPTGGMIGYTWGNGRRSFVTIEDSKTSGTISSPYQVGGFVGECLDTDLSILHSQSMMPITGGIVGGFVGSYDPGSASSENANNNFTIARSFAQGNLSGGAVGGLVGYVRVFFDSWKGNFSLSEVYYAGDISGAASSTSGFGGLIGGTGSIAPNITDAYFLGNINAPGICGGIIGGTTIGATLTRVSATGTITGAENAGGLMGGLGRNTSGKKPVFSATDSFAKIAVRSTKFAGGINASNIKPGSSNRTDASTQLTRVYADGPLTSTLSEHGPLWGGGFKVGTDTATDTYWDLARANTRYSSPANKLGGKTSSELLSQSTYSGWDFTSTWKMGATTPELRTDWKTNLPAP